LQAAERSAAACKSGSPPGWARPQSKTNGLALDMVSLSVFSSISWVDSRKPLVYQPNFRTKALTTACVIVESALVAWRTQEAAGERPKATSALGRKNGQEPFSTSTQHPMHVASLRQGT
jgi:hypothetical protein